MYLPISEFSLGFSEICHGTVDKYPSILLIPFDGMELSALVLVHHTSQGNLGSSNGFDFVPN